MDYESKRKDTKLESVLESLEKEIKLIEGTGISLSSDAEMGSLVFNYQRKLDFFIQDVVFQFMDSYCYENYSEAVLDIIEKTRALVSGSNFNEIFEDRMASIAQFLMRTDISVLPQKYGYLVTREASVEFT